MLPFPTPLLFVSTYASFTCKGGGSAAERGPRGRGRCSENCAISSACVSNLDCLVPLCNPQEGKGNAPVVVGALSDFLDPSTRSIFHQQKSTFLAESRFHPSIHDKLNGPSLCEAALDDGGKRAKAARGNVKEGKEERADGQRRTEAEDLLQLEVKRSSIDSLGKKRKRRLLRANREGGRGEARGEPLPRHRNET